MCKLNDIGADGLITPESLSALGFERDGWRSVPHLMEVYRFTNSDGKSYTASKEYGEDEWSLHADDSRMQCIGSVLCTRIGTVVGIMEALAVERDW